MARNFDIMISDKLEEYPHSITLMQQIVEEIIDYKKRSTIWFLQHPEIYTAGRLSTPKDLLESRFPVYHTGRGGQYTYHGPGQRIVYLMWDLRANKDIRLFINYILTAVQRVFMKIGLYNTYIDYDNIGVWIYDQNFPKKLVAMGIHIKKWVTYHGIAVNIAPNLEHYTGIIPCGIKEGGVTSLAALGYNICYEVFDTLLVEELSANF